MNENVTPNGIFSIEGLDPSTNYNIMVKCFNSAGMTSTMYTASTLTAYGGLFIKILCCFKRFENVHVKHYCRLLNRNIKR